MLSEEQNIFIKQKAELKKEREKFEGMIVAGQRGLEEVEKKERVLQDYEVYFFSDLMPPDPPSVREMIIESCRENSQYQEGDNFNEVYTYDDILKWIKKKYGIDIPRDKLSTTISVYRKNNELFEKIDRGVFAIRWPKVREFESRQ